MRNRVTTITLGGKTSTIEAAETGILQRLPVSPILFLFFNAPLLEKCAALKLPVLVSGFVHDVHLLAYSHSTEANCETITKAHDVVSQ